ncbi:baseplate J/gp47 family protein [Burkholderia stagnalis]|uniref:baseplate J/gp47 family protein n=1 Tax=Burkholderia stagnalis TaxID=1503054 RepID=UPI00075204EB|nr:baseplate J/gp47 family protein [Burkholderia stagnalis]KVC61560.1 baseplate assembly protein [Burkholderia stagnalis]KVN15140.1 baseplate assembly protein [Burkholderia stagnalis]KWI63824.1 baseplate assembly protein [Burkholderia stagnalis]KWK61986.1 baseplate assembly protein [Burkholderia stagnalis]KWN14869.1 baseplate assembly protein [Burkholderia stagnalis]
MSVTPIDLSQLPSPDVVETLAYEALLAERKARLVALYPADEQAEIAATLALESEPMVRLLQENAYRELVLRQRVNDAARAVMLAYATGRDLDNLAALFGIERLTITPADPEHDIEAVMESDTDLRTRTQLAPQRFSVAGPEGAYVSHARNADGGVLDASAVSPAPCEVLVTVLARGGDGTADPALLKAVTAALQADDVRPLTDKVTVRGAEVLRYAIRARLVFFAGPDRAVALAQANKAMRKYADDMHRLGMEVTLDGIYAAARAAGVQKVILESPLAGIPATRQQAPYCTGIELIDGGVYGNE